MTTTTPDVPYRTRSASHRDGATNSTGNIRSTCEELGRVLRTEMENTAVSDLWPAITKLIESNSFASDEMRALALRYFTDDLTAALGETRQVLNAAIRRHEAEARKATAARRPRALIA